MYQKLRIFLTEKNPLMVSWWLSNFCWYR